MESHQQQLAKHCRVCGNRLSKAKGRATSTYSCSDYRTELMSCFGINVLKDTDTIHPPRFCNPCFLSVRRSTKSAQEGVPHKHSIVVFEWVSHTDNCLVSLLHKLLQFKNDVKIHAQVCQHFDRLTKGGGQNQKGKRGRGRPSGETPLSILEHIQQIAPESFLPDEDKAPLYESESSQLSCPICCTVLDQPVELVCGSIICASCCHQWVQHNPISDIPCPSCYDHDLNSASIRPSPSLVLTLLSDLVLHCIRCGKLTKTSEYTRHLSSNCTSFFQPMMNSPSKVTLKDVLTRPVSSPATPMERKVTEHLVRRLLDENTGEAIKVPTRGQVGCSLQYQFHNLLHNNSTAPHPCASKQLSQIKCSCLHQNSPAADLSAPQSAKL